MTNQRIVRLQSENVKRLRAVEITPEGNVIIIGGENGQGKTSVLDSIEMALGGGKAIPDKPIRQGAGEARIVVETESLRVVRKFTPKGSYLEVRNADGDKITSPQAILDQLVGDLAFDPLAFSRMKQTDQADTLRRLAGIDVEKIDRERARVYELRTETNRELKRAEAMRDEYPEDADAPDEIVSVSELTAELEKIAETNRERETARTRIGNNERERERIAEDIANLRERIAGLEARDAQLAKQIDSDRKTPDPIDTTELRDKIRTAEADNDRARRKQERAKHIAEANRLREVSERYSAEIRKIDRQKAETLAGAKYPIDGLGFDDEGRVTFQGVPFSQASAAETLRVSVAMGLAMNPRLRVILIRDGSLLDASSMTEIARIANEQDAQVWIERVGDGDESAVIIEDGEILVKDDDG